MAPRTRRSLALQNSPETDAVSVGTNTPDRVTTSAPPKRGPGRLKKVAIPFESGSSAMSAVDSRSESGDYSTPATSNVVTPVPSTVAKNSTAKVPVSQSTKKLQLATSKAQKSTRVGTSKVARTTTASTQILDDSEFDSWDDKPEESSTLLLDPPSSRRRSGRIAKHASRTKTELEDDDEEYMNDVIRGLGSAGVKDKGKAKDTGKAKAKPQAPSKRQMPPPSSDDADEDWAPPPKKKKAKSTVRARGSKHEPDSEDEPMAKSKHRGLGSIIDDSDDELLSSSHDYNDDFDSDSDLSDSQDEDEETTSGGGRARRRPRRRRSNKMIGPVPVNERLKLEYYHPELKTMWKTLEDTPVLQAGRAAQPLAITQQLKPFQLDGLAWMKAMENTKWKGGLLGDEMGLGKTIQAVSLIMSDHPAQNPTLVLVPPVALMQWTAEIEKYTRGALKTLVFHGTNSKARNMTAAELKKFHVLLMSYNTLESIYRKQVKGFRRQDGVCKEKSTIHSLKYHRIILDEAHCIKTKTTMTAKATFALDAPYRWCLTGTPLQNRIGEFFSLVRFLNIEPFASYFCKDCACTKVDWAADDNGQCKYCEHHSMRHISVFNQELLNPIQREGNHGEGQEAFRKLRLLTDRIMLRRLKKDHTNSMELPVKEIYVDSQFFGEAENDFANSIMSSGKRKFDTYVAQGVMLNNYANIFGLIMQMRQVADHPDLILKKSSEGGQNVLVCCICDEPAEEAIRSRCKHDFCRSCAKTFINSQEDQEGEVECPRCHIPLSIDLEQPEMEQDEAQVKKSSIINRIKMENWTSSSKIELLVHELHRLRKNNATHKSIIFSQFTTMLQLIEWRLRRAGITTVMLDGSMTPAQRQGSINHFMQKVDVECFLVSLKAGGVALNLTEASRVFIVDPWWNPAAEWQSADRCHRIGQTRPCIITRLCIEDSVESRMVLLQEKKTSMINSTINSDEAAMESLSAEDLQFLFRGN